MRLTSEFRTRTVYAVTLMLCALLPGSFLSILVGAKNGTMLGFMMAWVLLMPASLGWVFWPKYRRSGWKMAGIGFAITAISIVGGGALAGLIFSFGDPQTDSLWDFLTNMVGFGTLGLAFGSVFTLGIPWFLGIGISILFRDGPT